MVTIGRCLVTCLWTSGFVAVLWALCTVIGKDGSLHRGMGGVIAVGPVATIIGSCWTPHSTFGHWEAVHVVAAG